MKRTRCRSILTLALALGVAASVAAVERSEDGYGDVLLFPYFASHGEAQSLLTVALRDQPITSPLRSGAAVRVAFRQPTGADGTRPDPVLVNLVLKPDDSWVVALGSERLIAPDDSCLRVARGGTLLAQGAGPVWPQVPAGEGWIEVFELGRVVDPGLLELARTDCHALWNAVEGVAPEAWLEPPRGDLRGSLQWVEVDRAAAYSIAPVTLRGFRNQSAFAEADVDHPTLADVAPAQARVRMDDGGWRLSHFSEHPAEAVSAVLMDVAWEHDFTIAQGLGARTDLVIALPTRVFHGEGQASRPPFAHDWLLAPLGAPETHARVVDREGDGIPLTTAALPKCSPAPRVPTGPRLEGELVVLEFGERGLIGSAFGRTVVQWTGDCFGSAHPVWKHLDSGRYAIRFDLAPAQGIGGLVSDEGHVFLGQPAIGAVFTRIAYENAYGGGVDFTYGLTQPISRRAEH